MKEKRYCHAASHRYQYLFWGANTVAEIRALVRAAGYMYYPEILKDYKDDKDNESK